MTKEGVPKIADFGLAKIVDSQTFLKVCAYVIYQACDLNLASVDFVWDPRVSRTRGARWLTEWLFGEGR